MENEFDRNLQRKILKQASNMDVNAFWDRLEPKLPRDTSRPKFLVFFMFLIVGLCGVLFAWQLFLNHKVQQSLLSTLEPIDGNKTILFHKQNIDFDLNKDLINNIIVSNETNASENLNKEFVAHSNSNTEHHISSLKHESNEKLLETNTLVLKNVSVDKIDKDKALLEKVNDNTRTKKSNVGISQINASLSNIEKNIKDDVKSQIILGNENQINIENTSNQIENQNSAVSTRINEGNKQINLTDSKLEVDNTNQDDKEEMHLKPSSKNINIPNYSLIPDSSSAITQQNADAEFNSDVNNTSMNILPIILNLFPIEDRTMDVMANQILDIDSKPKVNNSNISKINVSILPYIGLGGYSKKLKSIGSNDTLDNYVWLRNQAESNLEEWICGFDFNVRYKKIAFMTGLEYVQRNEKLVYYSQEDINTFGMTNIRREQVKDTIEIIDTISGMGWYGSNTIRNVVNYNKICQWNLPIGLNYQISIQDINFSIGFGAMISLRNQIIGRTIDTHLNISEWNHSADLKYKKSLGLGWYGDVGCSYVLNNRIAITTGIRLQYFPTNYLSGPLSLHYMSAIFRTGLTINLNR